MTDHRQPLRQEAAVKPEPTFLGWTWHAHFAELHRLIVEERWIAVAKSLSVMLGHALDKATEQRGGQP